MTGTNTTAGFEEDFARRAAVYLREQGLSEIEIQDALVEELGLGGGEAEELIVAPEAA